jgi:hypothetical protein
LLLDTHPLGVLRHPGACVAVFRHPEGRQGLRVARSSGGSAYDRRRGKRRSGNRGVLGGAMEQWRIL